MITLGDYSNLCRRMDNMLCKVLNDKIQDKSIMSNYELLELESDGMVKIEGWIPMKGPMFTSVHITDKGRELLNRGGYSNFGTHSATKWHEEYPDHRIKTNMEQFRKFSYAVLVFGEEGFFIPAPEHTALKHEFDACGEYMFETPFGSGWWFDSKESDLEAWREYFKEQMVPYIYVKRMDMEEFQ